MHTYMHACMPTCLLAQMHAYITYIHVRTYLKYICTPANTCMHTHIHTLQRHISLHYCATLQHAGLHYIESDYITLRYISLHYHTYMCACVSTYIHTNVHTHTCIHTHIDAYIHACMHACINACVHAYILTCIRYMKYIHT